MPWLLVGFGVGQFVGTLLGGRGADPSVPSSLLITVGGLTVVLALFAVTASSPVLDAVWLVLLGATGFGAVPALQTRVIALAQRSPAWHRARTSARSTSASPPVPGPPA